ncbi:MAG: leucine-rich repeat domain-containing protein, partial [Promethearchaeota archaeon]
MQLDPDRIKGSLAEIGKKEGLTLLRELIDSSNDPSIRQRSLEIYGSIEDGKDFAYLEQLFLSDENLDTRLTAGKILRDKYDTHKKINSLFEYSLKNVDNIQQIIFSLKALSFLDSIKARKILRDYLKFLMKTKFVDKILKIPEEIVNFDFKNGIPRAIIEICINLLLNDYYVRICGYLSTLRKGKIISLDCESVNLKNISDIVGLRYLDGLEHLNIQRTRINRIDHLQNFKNLKYLNLSHNQIEKIENLQSLVRLEELDLSYNKISKIENLEKLQNLSKLSFEDNLITEIENLNSLINLEELNINYNNISEIKNLENLDKLKKISLSSNRLNKIEGFGQLNNLIWVSISDNKITRI